MIQRFRFRCSLQLSFAFPFRHPEDGVVRVAVYRLVGQPLLLHQRQGMDDSEKLTDVVGALHGSEVEHLLPGLQVYGLILHGARVAAAGCIYSPSVSGDLHGQRQHRVVSVCRWVLYVHCLLLYAAKIRIIDETAK